MYDNFEWLQESRALLHRNLDLLLDLRINDGFAKMILLRQIKKSSLDIFLLCPNQTVIVVCVFNRDGLSLSCTKRFLNTLFLNSTITNDRIFLTKPYLMDS